MAERKKRINRTPTEIKGDFMAERFYNHELLPLLRLQEFRPYWDQIRETLRGRKRIAAAAFPNLHSLEECEVEDLFIRNLMGGEKSTVFGEELRKYRCNTHKVESGEFVRRNLGPDGDVD